jgi:two-component system, chemotaxis family, protein-glutamate methylesterase/glutaminase
MKPIKVLIVDDSAVVRQVLSSKLGEAEGIEVIATAADPVFAMARMQQQWPDVIVLDVEMPRMDGISFLKKIMEEHPTPVIICSTLTQKGAETTVQAMSAGAVGIVPKSTTGIKQHLQDSSNDLVHAVRCAGKANIKQLKPVARRQSVAPKLSADAVLPQASGAMAQTTEAVVAIGTSTGGTQALEVVLTALPRVSPGIVVVQHMPEKFTEAFARRLNGMCQVEVVEAKKGDSVIPGRALIAPGGRHLLLRRSGARYYVDVVDGPPVSRHRPSVDVLFRSVAGTAGRNALGIIMTGMGDDGAHGLKEMRNAGAKTIAQDEASCVVYGMPKEAVKLGAVEHIMPLEEISGAITRTVSG